MNTFSLRLTGALLGVALVGSLTCASVNAQTAPLPSGSFVPMAAPAPAPAPAPAALPAPAASHLAAARQLVVASGLSRAFGGVVPDMMGKMYSNFSQTRPEVAKDLKTTLDAMQPELSLYTDEMINFAGLVYTTLLSEQECKDALAFFSSPVGKKFVDAQPAIFGNLGPAVGEWSKSVSVRMMERVRAEMKKKGHEL